MTVLGRARAMRYEVGTNLKGKGTAGVWQLLLPSLEIGSVEIVGTLPGDETDTIDRLTDRRSKHSTEERVDLVVVGRGGDRLLAGDAAMQAMAERLNSAGAIISESRGDGRAALARWPGPTRALRGACKAVAEEHIRIAPCSKGTNSGSGCAFRAGTRTSSAKPPSRSLPIISPVAQNCSRPARQSRQPPQVTR